MKLILINNKNKNFYKQCVFIFILFLNILFLAPLLAQQNLHGKVMDATANQVLSNAEVIVMDSAGVNVITSTKTDVDGIFNISINKGNTFFLEVKKNNYVSKIITDIHIDEQEDINVLLDNKADMGKEQSLEEISVKVSRKKESINASISIQKNINLVAQVIGAEFINKLPDRNVGEVVKRIPGASIQDGKYIIIRGLSDRYNQAVLNGNLMSSTEPDRKVFSLDIFPSSVISNIIISKSFVPENSGDVAGGIVNIETKDVPDRDFLNVQVGTGFNSQAFKNNFYYNPGGSLEWLGIENGTRKLSSSFPSKDQMFKSSNNQKNEAGKTIYNNWQRQKLSLPLFYNFQINGGWNKILENHKAFGLVYAINYYNRSTSQDFERNVFEFPAKEKAIASNITQNERDRIEANLGAMLNFSFKMNNNHKLSFKNLISNVSNNSTLIREGFNYNISQDIKGLEFKYTTSLFYSTQLISENNFPAVKLKVNAELGYTTLLQDIPGQKRVEYRNENIDGKNQYVAVSGLTIAQNSSFNFYSNLNDNVYFGKIDIIKKYNLANREQVIKIGGLQQNKIRDFIARPFGYKITDINITSLNDPQQIFSYRNLGTGNNQVQFDEMADKQFLYAAHSYLSAFYLQSENKIGSHLSVVWGARFEYFVQQLEGYNGNTPVPVDLNQPNFMPSINLNYSVDKKTNVRLAYSKTLARPEFREFAPFSFFDFELSASVVGYPKLKITEIDNFDLRYEFYPRAGELLSIGTFAKIFKNPIEQYFNDNGPESRNFNFLNVDNGIGYGVEFETRKKLDFADVLKDFTFWGNFSYLFNRVSSQSSVDINRPMQGLSPYLINLGLQYNQEKIGFSCNVLFNIIGRRILYVGGETIPNVWEAPRPFLDLQLAQYLLKKKLMIRANITNILNPKAILYHDLNSSGVYEAHTDAIFLGRYDGTNVTLTLTYNIF